MADKKQRESGYKLDHLISLMEKIAVPIPAIPAIAPIPAIPQIITSGDHDLLTKLDGKVDSIQADVTVLKNQDKQNITQEQYQAVCIKANDMEVRMRASEKSITQIWTYGTAGMIALGIVEFLLNKFVN